MMYNIRNSKKHKYRQEWFIMNYRRLGKTGLMVSEIGFGGEWLEKHSVEESTALIRYAGEHGINIIDCWMSDPKSRDIIGLGIAGQREQWYIQGQIGSIWKDGQYARSRDLTYVKPAFEDLLTRMKTDYIDLGMIHYIDSMDEWFGIQDSDFLRYVFELKEKGTIRHIGLSSHNPRVAKAAAESGYIEMILFSINPAFDMMPPGENIEDLFADQYDGNLAGIDPERAELYRVCEREDVGLTVMKCYGGGRLLNASASQFGVALTPVQCIHYALTKPAVASVLVGYDTPAMIDAALAYETATDDEKDYASVLAGAPMHSYKGECTYCGHCRPCAVGLDIAMINKFYDLATMQDDVPESVRGHYLALGATASACLGCGACEPRCPFEVPITERMRLAAELFGV